ncbi:aminopeptidase [Spirochaetia bacterium]|nr:aminopeptidase [Spirochaetia bacterium]
MLSGCYTLTQGGILLGYLGRAVPLESINDNSSTDGGSSGDAQDAEKKKLFVENVHRVRQFAINELGLKETKNYTKYVKIDNDYLAAIVSACDKDKFNTHKWSFPVIGQVPYKGFFRLDDAKKEADKLKKKNLDVLIRPVDAFSTLGWFNDPIYSFMLDYSDYAMADLIIHESFHATLFLKNKVQFNEEIAEFIGGEGARLYMEKMYGKDNKQIRDMEESKTDNAAFVKFIQGMIKALDEVYNSGVSIEEKLLSKEKIIAGSKERFKENYDSMFLTDRYKNFVNVEVNNAYLELYRLYYDGGSALKELYEAHGSNLTNFINAAKKLTGKGDPMEQLKTELSKLAAIGIEPMT